MSSNFLCFALLALIFFLVIGVSELIRTNRKEEETVNDNGYQLPLVECEEGEELVGTIESSEAEETDASDGENDEKNSAAEDLNVTSAVQ